MTTTHADGRHTSTPEAGVARHAQLLQWWSIGMVVFGVATAAVPWVRTDLFGWITADDVRHIDRFGADARGYVSLLSAIVGALTAGFGVSLWWLARVPLARAERWAWWAFATAVADWYVIDNIASVAFGFPRNVVSNTVLIAPAVAVLAVQRRTIRV